MWDESLIESRREKRRSWFTFPVAVFAHGLVVLILIGVSYWSIGAVPAPVLSPPNTVLIHFVPNEPGGGGPVRMADKPPKHSTAPVPQIATPVVVPVPETSNLNVNDIAPATNTLVTSAGDSVGSQVSGPGGSGDGSSPGIPGGYPDADRPRVITAEIQQPVLIQKVKPIYPPLATKAHIEGYVILEAVITKTGSVGEIRVLQSANALLTDAAISAVQKWLYKPANMNGRAISVYFTVTVKFELN